MSRILVLSAHTDDAEFACAGTIDKLLDLNHTVYWITMVGNGYDVPEGFQRDTLPEEFDSAMRVLLKDQNGKNRELYWGLLGFEVSMLERDKALARDKLYHMWKAYDPDIVFSMWYGCRHQDHRTLGEITRQIGWRDVGIYYYTPPNEIFDFHPNVLSPLKQKHLEKKQQVIREYKSQFELRSWLTERLLDKQTMGFLPFIDDVDEYPLIELFYQDRRIEEWDRI